MPRKLVAGTGWKMNKTASEARRYITDLLPLLDIHTLTLVEVFVLPPFTSLAAAGPLLQNTQIGVGGQNMHWENSGAWTGEISAPMLVEAGCRYVELGHSERRYYFNETDEFVNLKVLAALAHNLVPIICIGETADEKDAGRTEAVLEHQIRTALRNVAPQRVPNVLLAYEPRWAIGQADAAHPDYIQNAHAFIRDVLAHAFGNSAAKNTRVIYGGSVNLDNSAAIIQQADVDGLFIGRAALYAPNFAQMVRIVAEAAVSKPS
ncbi:MAG: triose-phosphate isomerase [Aggregatilineales bacterium]